VPNVTPIFDEVDRMRDALSCRAPSSELLYLRQYAFVCAVASVRADDHRLRGICSDGRESRQKAYRSLAIATSGRDRRLRLAGAAFTPFQYSLTLLPEEKSVASSGLSR
jgi:hypothetical protein